MCGVLGCGGFPTVKDACLGNIFVVIYSISWCKTNEIKSKLIAVWVGKHWRTPGNYFTITTPKSWYSNAINHNQVSINMAAANDTIRYDTTQLDSFTRPPIVCFCLLYIASLPPPLTPGSMPPLCYSLRRGRCHAFFDK